MIEIQDVGRITWAVIRKNSIKGIKKEERLDQYVLNKALEIRLLEYGKKVYK